MKNETDFPPADESRIRATAWALGQLSPEEQAAFEAEMQSDSDLAAYALDMMKFCGVVSKELPLADADEKLPEITREKIVKVLAGRPANQFPRATFKVTTKPGWFYIVTHALGRNWLGLGAVACLVAILAAASIGGYSKITPGARHKMAMLAAQEAWLDPESISHESYQAIPSNKFQKVTDAPLSTFSIDVDTASYSNVRRFLNDGERPPAEAVRLEELVNYFTYDEAPPQDGKPFSVKVDLTSAPWKPEHRLTRIVLKGKEIAAGQRPASNLVFLVDVSGSMADANKLPLVQQSLRLLTEQLTENDRVSLVTYAGSTSVVLPSTNGQEKAKIRSAIDSLNSKGSTNGAGGLNLAYQQAAANFIKDGVNRVILATDGDFNVGISSHEELLTLIQAKAESGIFLSMLGYGTGNLKDDTMELLADKGNGNYAYIDSIIEARKALVEQMSGTLVTIAKDVKIQIEFNPAVVQSWRLLGYENRLLAKEDFNDDKKDAGEIGAGHQVTALYEIIPVGVVDQSLPAVDDLKYQQVASVTAPKRDPAPAALTGELMNVKLRYKEPAGEVSQLLEVPVQNQVVAFDQISQEARWATAVAAFAQRLRGDTTSATLTWEQIRQLARSSKGPDALGYRGEFLQLIDKAEAVCP